MARPLTGRSWKVLLLLAMGSLSSCVGYRRSQYSEPTVQDSSVTLRYEREAGEVFVMGDVRFNFYPANSVNHDVMLFPLPLDGGRSGPAGPIFYTNVELWSRTEDLQLDVTQIQFWRDDPTRRVAVKSFQGPFRCNSGSDPNLRGMPPTTIRLQGGVCSWLWVAFDTTSPDPKESFVLKLGGVSAGGRVIDLPDVKFGLARKTESVTLP